MKQLVKKPAFKKNQMIITALAAMIAVTGYLNYSGTKLDASLLGASSTSVGDSEDIILTGDISAEDIYAETGEADYSDIESLDEDVDLADTSESLSDGTAVAADSTADASDSLESAASDALESAADESAGETVMASSSVGVGLVAEAKVTREQTRSKNKEILMELINSANITEEQKQSAIDEMVEMTDVAEKELAAETLLAAQGFDQVVVSIYDSCADVVVSSAQVSESQRAQIEDIVKRKTGIDAANITITPVTSVE